MPKLYKKMLIRVSISLKLSGNVAEIGLTLLTYSTFCNKWE